MNWDMETDVVVVGGGGCGIAAALTVKQKGLEVILIEKGNKLGGNTTLSTGSIPGANTKYQQRENIKDSALQMAKDIYAKANNQGNWELLLHLCEQSKELVEWLVEDMKVKIDIITEYKHVGHTQFRLHAPKSRKGEDLVKDLTRALDEQGVIVATNIECKDLIVGENNEVIGIKTIVNGKEENIKCKKVILATNGFGANKKMVKKYIPEISGAPYFGAVGSTGEAIEWGERLGAELKSMGAYQGYAAVSNLGSIVSWTTVEKGGFLVNKAAKRFCDESKGYSALAGNVQSQEDGVVHVIFDQTLRDSVYQSEDEFKEMCDIGAVKGGVNTIEELAKLLKLDCRQLEATFDDYQRSAVEGNDPFNRKDFGHAPLIAPFYGVQATSGLFHTQGGLNINKHAQPLRHDGSVIENLYAGGGVAVGVSGTEGSSGYSSGNGLFTALGWGRLAGKHAAESILSEQFVGRSERG
jgi:fumarate reductase flavoprotein subunit